MATSRIAEHVGRVLGDRYRLTRPLGTGASAHVYVAEDVTLRRRVAVKLLHPGLADDEGFLRRFQAEARVVAGLRHPNILRVYDWGEDDGAPFLVMELLEGGSMRSLLDRGTLLTPAQAAVIGADAARALDYAHRRGLVHRDIKPANIMMEGGRPGEELGKPLLHREQYQIADINYVVDIAPTQEVLDWHPTRNDEDMLVAAYAHYRKQI